MGLGIPPSRAGHRRAGRFRCALAGAAILAVAVVSAGIPSAAAAESTESETELIGLLSHKDPAKRAAAATLLGERSPGAAIPALLDALSDDDAGVKKAVGQSLERLSGQSLGPDPAPWRKWWDSEGKAKHPPPAQTFPMLQRLQDWILLAIAMAMLILFVIVFMAGYKLKQLKDIMRRADQVVVEAEAARGSAAGLVDELERRKNAVLDFIGKQKDEAEAEIERFSDLLQQNIEHRMREVTMNLREKAERELEQTLRELREDVERDVRKIVIERQQPLLDELSRRHATFIQEVDAHTLFLEASFYFINNKHEEAIRYYKKLLALKPDHWNAWLNKGTALRSLLRHDEALDAFSKALEYSQENPAVYYQMAATYALQKRKDAMMEHLKKAIHRDGEFKDEALNDTAFKDYWADADFKELAEG